MIWDGAYQFDMTLATQRPYVYLTRFHTFFLWYPTVWASRWTSNVDVLQSIFGLPFLLAPVTGLLFSWFIVRNQRPSLMVWVVFGIVMTVPGQIFVINDSFFQMHLFWPLFVAMFVRVTRLQCVGLAILAVFQFAHPVGALLMFGAAVAAAPVATVDTPNRRRLLIKTAIMLGLSMLAVGKIILTNHVAGWTDKYAQDEATWANAQARWRASLTGAPLHGLIWIWVAAVLIFLQPFLFRRGKTISTAAAVLAILAICRAASHWLFWAHGPVCLWGGAIDYRRWVAPLTAPIFLLASAEVFIASFKKEASLPQSLSPNASAAKLRGVVAMLCALLFAVTLGMQYTTWHQRAQKLMAAVKAYPTVIVPNTDPALTFVDHSPLAHWGTGNYVSAMLGKQPDKLFLDEVTERIVRGKYFDSGLSQAERDQLGWYYYASQPDVPPGPGGWFDFRPALAQARREQSTPSRRQPGFILNGIP